MAKLKRKRKSRHSPAGLAWLEAQKAKTKPVYFRGIKRKTVEEQLQEAGVTGEKISRLKRKRKRG